jgi:hypothetical protein
MYVTILISVWETMPPSNQFRTPKWEKIIYVVREEKV